MVIAIKDVDSEKVVYEPQISVVVTVSMVIENTVEIVVTVQNFDSSVIN